MINQEYQEVGRTKEQYLESYQKLINRARDWQQHPEHTRIVTIPEPNLAEHFENNWTQNDSNYINEILDWRGEDDDEVLTPTVIKSERTGKTSFIVDTNDLSIGSPEDEFFFHRLGRCLGFVFDIERQDDTIERIAFHMPGTTVNDLTSTEALMDTIKKQGSIKKLVILYNSKRQTKSITLEIKNILPEVPEFNDIDLGQLDDSFSHDVFVNGSRVDQYYNEGHWDSNPPTRSETITRHKSGEWTI